MLFTDEVSITSSGVDPVFNFDEDGNPITVKAYIENNTKIRYGSDGSPYMPSFLIFLPGRTSIVLEDKIQIVKLHGQDPVGNEIGEKSVMQIKRVGGFSISHIEVLI